MGTRTLKKKENVFDNNFVYDINLKNNIRAVSKKNTLPQCKQALKAVQPILANTPILLPPNPTKQFIIYSVQSFVN